MRLPKCVAAPACRRNANRACRRRVDAGASAICCVMVKSPACGRPNERTPTREPTRRRRARRDHVTALRTALLMAFLWSPRPQVAVGCNGRPLHPTDGFLPAVGSRKSAIFLISDPSKTEAWYRLSSSRGVDIWTDHLCTTKLTRTDFSWFQHDTSPSQLARQEAEAGRGRAAKERDTAHRQGSGSRLRRRGGAAPRATRARAPRALPGPGAAFH